MEQYAYTGDVKLLKGIGYTFQKLYARNYKSYHKDDNFMFVASKMVLEIGNVKAKHQVAYIGFILANKDKPKEFWVSDRVYPTMTFTDMANYHLTQYGNIVDDQTMSDLTHASVVIRVQAMKHFDEGSITEGEYKAEFDRAADLEGGRDQHLLGLDRVELILELNSLHPLEKIA